MAEREYLRSLVFDHFYPDFHHLKHFSPIARDPKLTAEALGFRWSALKKNFCPPV